METRAHFTGRYHGTTEGVITHMVEILDQYVHFIAFAFEWLRGYVGLFASRKGQQQENGCDQ